MAMTLDDDQWIHEFFGCENQSSGPFNSDKSDEKKEPLDNESMGENVENKEPLDNESMSQNVEKEEETLVNKKQCEGGVVSESGNLNVKNDKGKDRNCRISSHEKHARAERERRRKMRSMLDNLQDLIPHLNYKVDSVTIVEETVKHINDLKQTLEKLEKQKKEKLKSFSEAFTADQRSFSLNPQMVTSNALAFQQMWFSQNVTFNICGDEAQFCIYTTKKPSLLTTIFNVMEKHKIEVIHANILCNDNGNSYMIQAHVKRATHESQNAISVEESYKLAAGEIKGLLIF